MNLRTYHAYTMADALEAVKSDLGADAVILHTRTFKRGGVLGIGAKNIVEVTAADSIPHADNERKPAAKAAPRERVASVSASAVDVQAARTNGSGTVTQLQAKRAYGSSEPASPLLRELVKAAAAEVPKAKAKSHSHAPVMSVSPTLQPDTVKITVPVTQASSMPASRLPKPPSAAAPVAVPPTPQKFVLKNIEAPRPPEVRVQPVRPVAPPTPPQRQAPAPQPVVVKPVVPQAAPSPPRAQAPVAPPAKPAPAHVVKQESPAPANTQASQAMQDELAAIRSMVGQVLQRQVKSTGKATAGVPQQLFDMYLQLISHDLAEELADEVVSNVAKSLSPEKLDDEEAVRSAVLAALAEYIQTAEPREPVTEDGKPLTIALVGPTGVGKTTTLAKMAATFKLHQKKSVGLVTCDTYRIAAVDQLTTYAKIIGVPLRVARTAEEMRLAVAEFAKCDVVLIDTAGRGQRDSERLEELKEMVHAASPHEVHLVLSSTANEKVLLSEAEAFASIGADKIVLTKLDEAVSFGMLVNVLRQVGKRLSFVTTGQEVPDHFETGSATRLAELVLGTKGVE